MKSIVLCQQLPAFMALGVSAALVAGAWRLLRRRASVSARAIKITYFNLQGAAEPVRLALTLTGTALEDERLTFDAWQSRKACAKYGQLPIMTIDGEKECACRRPPPTYTRSPCSPRTSPMCTEQQVRSCDIPLT